MFVLSAPSGAGKTTLCRRLREALPDLGYSVSTTTRKPRAGEREGVDYFFVDRDAFRRGIEEGRWAEWAEVYGNFYGTSADFLSRTVAKGTDILLDIDVQGARQIMERFPDAVTIFVMPPSLETLRRRLADRGTDDADTIERRMREAEDEMRRRDSYRHVIVNDRLEAAAEELIALVRRYRRDDGTGKQEP
ncbi:MAG: guanylate kinase [Desulfobacterales bacterium]